MLNDLAKQLQRLSGSGSPLLVQYFLTFCIKITRYGDKKYFPANRVYLTRVNRNKTKPFTRIKCMESDPTIHHKFEIPETKN